MILDILAGRAAVRLALYLRAQNRQEQARQLEQLAGLPASTEALAESADYLNALTEADEGFEVLSRLRHLTRGCELDELGSTAIEFALAFALLGQLPELLGEPGMAPTLERVVLWSDAPYAFADDFLYLEETAQKLSRILPFVGSVQPLCRQSFGADAGLLAYLCGGSELPPALAPLCRLAFWDDLDAEPLAVHQDAVGALQNGLRQQPRGWFQLACDDSGEAELIAEKACAQSRHDLLRADAGRRPADDDAFFWALERELLFFDALPCLHRLRVPDTEDAAGRARLDRFFALFSRLRRPVFFCTDADAALLPLAPQLLCRILIPRCTRGERIALWEEACFAEGLTDRIDCVDAGSRFRLTRAEIHRAAQLLGRQSQPGPAALAEACSAVLPPPRQGDLKRIAVSYTLDDLKLPPEQKRAIASICSHVRFRHQVYDDWNMESRYPYGRNVSALFVGPPGTGKTMAAHVMATLLELPLYQINLSQVVDKYIGETEKRLEDIFDTAEKSNTILFFDEADAIFGKRSEVSDAKDKYANTEVSYILQRIEQYEGIVILATNYKKNIDEAFMRRMRYLIEFTLPGPALREEIWRSAFAAEVPLDHVDFAYLARQFELSGGAIKNIVLNAAFSAAREGSAVGMRQILDCVRGENLKMGHTMLRQDFAEYAALVSGDLP